MRFLLRVYLIFCFAVFLTAMVLLYPLMVLPVRLAGKRGRGWSHTGFTLWGGSFWLMGIRFYKHGQEHVPKTGPLLIVSNHQSLLDSPTVYLSIPRQFRTLGKVEMARFPVFGSLYKVACIIVDRSRSASRTASLSAIMRGFADGEAILIYPEGRMNPEPLSLQPFQEASFAIAQRMGVTIQPMVMAGTGRLLPGTGPLIIRPGQIHTRFCLPIPASEYKDLTSPALAELVRQRIDAELARFRPAPKTTVNA